MISEHILRTLQCKGFHITEQIKSIGHCVCSLVCIKQTLETKCGQHKSLMTDKALKEKRKNILIITSQMFALTFQIRIKGKDINKSVVPFPD